MDVGAWSQLGVELFDYVTRSPSEGYKVYLEYLSLSEDGFRSQKNGVLADWRLDGLGNDAELSVDIVNSTGHMWCHFGLRPRAILQPLRCPESPDFV